MLLTMLVVALQQEPDPVEVAVRLDSWIGSQKKSRFRSMEDEAIGKGGTGRGTLFTYEDVGADERAYMPELHLFVTLDGVHRFDAALSFAWAKGEKELTETLEFDGDLHRPGELIESKS